MTLETASVLVINRQARFNYEILDTFEAGIVLRGHEVKSVRAGQVSLNESFARIQNEEVWLTNMHIAPYSGGTPANYEPTMSRKLLLNKKEIKSLIGKLQEQGLSLVPLRLYIKKNRIKVELGLGRGKKKYDKRESLKRKSTEREINRKLRIGQKLPPSS